MNIQEYLKSIVGLPQKFDSVLKVYETFDTTLRVDNTSHGPKLCTYELNFFVNVVDFEYEDTLRASCFSYEYGTPVYSDPPVFDIAKLNPDGFGYIPDPGWEKWMVDNAINPDIIKRIKDTLKSKPPVNY